MISLAFAFAFDAYSVSKKEKTEEGKDVEITFEQYLKKVNERALSERAERNKKKKLGGQEDESKRR